ncbi:CENP-B homolog protein 2-like [Magnolia sinica]|uniref:CENP-B homolog protein 2-like n=1 Tax=Magnolia sinica TaxID=86752 RepID=UPI0026589DA7|nr:CENP-B homolog protein 2-like [Magnolia sinica]XP_058113774.1 CENP-B homolog protein 2-like [Magnolia sinica]XP_058113775.1 CENP-B homolog protein 2-like [Magnolia sinica]
MAVIFRGTVFTSPMGIKRMEGDAGGGDAREEDVDDQLLLLNKEAIKHSSKRLGKLTPTIRSKIAEHSQHNPTLTQKALLKWAEDMFGIRVTQGTISNILAANRNAAAATGNLTVGQKKAICEENERDPQKTQEQLAVFVQEKFNLSKKPSQATICQVLKRKKEFLKVDGTLQESVKRRSIPRFPKIEAALSNWVLQCQANQLPLSGQIIQEKGRSMARMLNIPEDEVPTFSDGWLHKFQMRHNFQHFRSRGKCRVADPIAVAMLKLKEITDRFELQDIFSMDEAALFYSMSPDRTIAEKQLEVVDKDKIRLTLALTCNANGSEKLPPLFVGSSARPRSFQKRTREELCFYYRNNKKALMTAVLFQEWLKKLDMYMGSRDRRILLLLDDGPSHVIENVDLGHVHVHFLPPDTTSKIQPLDAGIIAAFKRRYRSYQLQHAVDLDGAGERNIYKVNELQAIRWAVAAWKSIHPNTIINSWRHCPFLSPRGEDGLPLLTPMSNAHPLIEEVGETLIEEALVNKMTMLGVKDPLSIQKLIHPAIEVVVHAVFSNEDLLEVADEAGIEEEEDNGEEQQLKVTPKELLPALETVIRKLEEDAIGNHGILVHLLELKRTTRHEEVDQDESSLYFF